MRMIVAGTPTNMGNPYVPMPSFRSLYSEPLTLMDKAGNMNPLLATSWDLDPVARTITLHLRKGVKFQDGSDFNAEAVKWNMEGWSSFGMIMGSKDLDTYNVLDDYTLQLKFKNFSALALVSFTFSLTLYSPTAYKTNGSDWALKNAVGTGPFQQVDYKDSSYVKFKRFDNYWGPKPYLDGIDNNVVSDATVAALTMQSGGADVWDGADLKSALDLKAKGLQMVQYPSGSVWFLSMDTINPSSVFANKKVREAIEYAIDRPSTAQLLGYGSYTPLDQFANSMDMPYNQNCTVRTYDPQKAKQLLAEAGYPNGLQTKLYCGNNQAVLNAASLLQSSLKAAGIEVIIDQADMARMMDMVAPGGHGWKDGMVLTFMGMGKGLAYVQTVAFMFAPRPGGFFSSVGKSPKFVDLYNQEMSIPTLDQALEVGKQMIKEISDDCMVIPLWNTPNVAVYQKYVHTNLNTAFYNTWSPELDWMEAH
jgi:peptide/nickel transport system substrate-binding protein